VWFHELVALAATVNALPQTCVLGLPVHLSGNYVAWLAQRIQNRQGAHVVTYNAEMAMLALQEKSLAQLISQAELVVPDGAGVVWALGLEGQRVGRCPGIELVENVLPLLDNNQPVYLLGAGPGVTAQVATLWQNRYPNLRIAGFRDGYFRPEEEATILAQIAAVSPALVLVGIGVPKQEYLIQRWREHLPQTVWVGVGGSFDVWSGTKERAPKFFRDNSLEWLYRLYQEPHRWRRMLALPHFALTVLGRKLGLSYS